MTQKRSAGCALRQARWVIFFMPVSYSFSKSRDCVESEHEENSNEMVENGFFPDFILCSRGVWENQRYGKNP